jgi:RNA polymerase sigma-70 factor (ECF subfamily)
MREVGDTDAISVVGSDSEFDAFYRREFSTLAVLAGTVAGDRSTGEDIAQEALSRAHRDWPRVSTLDKPGAWARRVTINLAIGRKRRMASEARALLRLGPSQHVAAETRRGDPAVWAAVDELPPRQRAVIALRYLEDQTVAEIAEILEISVSAATSNLSKARANLATKLGEDHD